MVNFDPQSGHEQAGRRPALVLSPADYNDRTSLCIACPITNQAKGNPFDVPIPSNRWVSGVVLSDHVKSLDWRARQATRKGRVVHAVVQDVLDNIVALISPAS